MANVKKTIDIIFAGVDNLSGTINTVSGNMSSLGDSVHNISDPLANVADSILKTDAALIALAAGGLTYAFAKSKDYESSIIDLEKVMGDQEEITIKLEGTFTSLARTYGESTIEIVNALAGLRQSGYSTADGLEVLETSLKLARASELSAEESTNLLKRAMIGYNLTANEAIGLGDLWNQTSNVANTTVGKLAEGFAIVSRQAKDSGFSMTELSGALTPMIGVFDSGSEAGIAMSMTLTQLLNPTKEGEIAIRKLTGVTGSLNDEFKSGREIFEAVARGLQDVDARTGSVAVAQIVGAQQAKRIKVSFDDYFQTLEKIGPASAQYNSLQKEVDKQNASTQASVDRLVTGFESLAITVGEQFRESAKEAVDGGTAIENALEDIIKDKTFTPVFDALSEFSSKIGKYLKDIAIAMPEAFESVNWDGLLNALEDIGGKFGELFKDIDLTESEGLTEVIQFVIDSLESLVRITSGMASTFAPLIKGIMESISGFNSLDGNTKETTGNILAAAKAITDLGIIFAGILITIGQNADTLKSVFGVVINSIGFLWDTAVITIKSIQLAFYGLVKASWELADVISLGLSDAVKEQIKNTELLQEGLKSDILEIYASQVNHVSSALKSMAGDSKDASTNIEEISTSIKELPEDVAIGVGVNTEDAIKDSDYFLDIVNSFPETVESVIVIDSDNAELVIDNVKSEIEEIPSEKLLEIKLKGEIDTEIARIKSTTDMMQTSVEWTAKLNIADAESNAKIFGSIIDGISTTIESTGDALSGLWDLIADPNIGQVDKWDIEEQIEKENKMRKEAHDLQMKLNEAQLDFLQAKADAMESGEGLINITADGLEPEIEAFMWKILKKIQIRANEASSEFLLGV